MSNLKRFMKMKKFILSLGLIAMAFGLTNCTKNEEVNPVVEQKGDFAIYASTETRTANDGLNTVWVAGDDLGVFHAVTDDTIYIIDGQFKLEDVASGKFLGNVNGTLDVEEEYDWYAMYPYVSQVPGPANTKKGYMTIGCAASATQTQTGNNSMAHIKGTNYPLVGKACAVPANTSPALAMTHVATLLEFEVTNSLEEAITVSNIKFTAPSAIVGTFYIDFTDTNNINVASSGDSYTSKTATLAVENGDAIAPGASAKFYLPVAPFVAKDGDDLTIEVAATTEAGSGVHETDLTLTNDVKFSAGKIKTVNVNYTTEIESAEEHNWVNNAYNLIPSTAALSIGDKVIIVASGYNKAAGAQGGNNRPAVDVVKNADNTVTFDSKVAIFTVNAGKSTGCFSFKTADGKYIYAAGGSSSNHLKEEASLSTKSSWTVSIVNGVATIKAEDSATTKNTIRYNNAATNGNLFSCYSSGQTDVSLYKLVGEYTPEDPAIELSINNASLAYDATSGSATVTATYATGWTITATSSESWISNLVYSNGEINFTSEANEAEKERTATITVTATRDGYDTVTKTFVITQAAKASGDITLGTAYSYEFTAKQWTANGAKTLNGLNWTLAGSGSYWGYDGTKGQQFGSGNAPYKSMTLTTSDYVGGVKKIVIVTSGASSINGSFTVTVGGKQIGATTKLTSASTSYTLESDEMLSGDVVISYTQTSSKAIYIKKIQIN